jgi:leader peptidase (prepilin peptidase)/N-methyltransferase
VIAALAFLFGLLVGSFLNVCIHRWPRDLSVRKPSRSFCPGCEAVISWYDNVPLLSYLLLRRRCRACGMAISPRYPAVELLTAAAFAGSLVLHGPTLEAAKVCVFSALLIALLFADLETLILPDELTLGGLVLGLLFALAVPLGDNTGPALLWLAGIDVPPKWSSLVDALIGAGLPTLFLWLSGWLYWKIRQKEGLGFGDVKMMAMMGAFLGLRGSLLAMIVGSVLGSVIGLAYIKFAGKDPATYHLPFGTFLAIGGLAVVFFGRPFIEWYAGSL